MIAVKLDENKVVSYASENAQAYAELEGWHLIQNVDPFFSSENMYMYTVVDGNLVLSSSKATTLEELRQAITMGTKQNLSLVKENNQLKMAVTELTKQNINSSKENNQLKSAITELTKQVIDLKNEKAGN